MCDPGVSAPDRRASEEVGTMRPTRPAPAMRRVQRGVMLLEALIAILIFSVGILGLVGLQATAVKQSTDARMRSEAAQLADRLIGQMWTDNRVTTALQAKYNTCLTESCPGYRDWVTSVSESLPGVTITSPLRPAVTVNNAGIVTISIFWSAPGDDAASAAHRYDVEAQIQ
jgi:type IV pilus assembly protein PilV